MPARKPRTTAEVGQRMAGDACAGCRTLFAKKGYLGGGGASVELFPGKKAKVCWGRGSRASERCTMLARERESACPGCGDKPCVLGTICLECERALKRGKTLEARKMEWWGIAVDGLGPYLSEREKDDWTSPMNELAELLCKAVASGRVVERHDADAPKHHLREVMATIPSKLKSVDYSRTDILFVELVAGQGAALEALVEKIRVVMRKQYRHGFEQGDSILRRLADGERGLLESERDLEQARERHAFDDERRESRELASEDDDE